MQRVTLTLDDDLLAALEALSARRGYKLFESFWPVEGEGQGVSLHRAAAQQAG